MNFAHQRHLFNPENACRVIVVGAGAVGSYVVLALAKMGVRQIDVWDGDAVASHNVPMSLYRECDIGKLKTVCLQEIIESLTGARIEAHGEYYAGQDLRNAIVIACVDTMNARTMMWSRVKDRPTISLFIDTRLAAAYVEVLAVRPQVLCDVERYEKLLFSDEKAVRQTCGMHGIVFASMSAGSAVAAMVAAYLEAREYPWRYAIRSDTLAQAFCVV